MFFFFKQKEIHVDCFTSKQYVHDLYPIDYTHKFFPDWWKALPKSYDKPESLAPIPTIKSCIGFNNYFKYGMSIPLWSDIYVANNGDGTFAWQYSDGVSGAMSHDFKQMDGGIDVNKYIHLKLHSPWLIRCKESIDWAWTGNTWGFYDPSQFVIPPAVINYKYNMNADINMFLNFQGTNGKIFLKQGTPMVNIIPLTERKVKIHLHKVSNEEYFNLRESLIPTSFLNKYGTQKRIMEQKEEESKKCPFGFGK